jgi:hypothetical protein
MKKSLLIVTVLMALFVQNCVVLGWFIPPIDIWLEETKGRAELERSKYSKQILVEEAQAQLDSAKLLNQAEVLRATGTAEANRILGSSLKNNEAYLRYLWIQEMNKANSVYYVPTEAGMPILEAGKRK